MASDHSSEIDPELLKKHLEARAEHLAALGDVANNWAILEHTVDSSSIALGKLPLRAASCLTSQIMGIGRKLDAYISIAREVGIGDKTLKTLIEFSKKSKGLSELRNRALHDPWILAGAPENAQRFEVTARQILRAQLVNVPTDELRRLSENISNVIGEFETLHTLVMSGTAP